MEIETTIKDLPEKIRALNIPPETNIRIIIPEEEENRVPPKGSRFLFLDSPHWDGEGPSDISENLDDYLYDEESIHGR
ncbi:MAG: hypothetical protein ACLFRG_15205 [Desulfococcaceae bacterium]